MAETISITICGDGGCGKSSITLRLVRSQWTHEYDPTIEDSYSVTRTVDGLPYFLALTDTAGQEEYRGLWAASNLKSDAFLLVYDITNKASVDALDYFMEMIDIEAEQRLEDNQRLIKGRRDPDIAVGMAPPVKIVAGNKCDLKDARVVSARTGLEWARKRGCGFMETSAREMVNIEETFALIVRRVVEARRLHHLQQLSPENRLGKTPLSPKLPSHPLYSPDLPAPSQFISHSKTPPLTAHERALSEEQDKSRGPETQNQKHWRGLGRAVSKKLKRIKKTGDGAFRGDRKADEREQTSKVPSDDTETKGTATQKKVPSRPQSRADQDKVHPFQEAFNHTEKEDMKDEDGSDPWWRRMNCAF